MLYISSCSLMNTGSLQRTADLSRPYACRALDGVTTRSPAMPMNTFSMRAECCAPSWCAVPPGERITTGAVNWPPDM